jgi:hypothetical protein
LASIEDDNGWHRGWWSEVHGLHAFLEAMGLDVIPEASERLGPFYDERGYNSDLLRAYGDLATRLLAMLVIVSKAALDANPEAQAEIKKQTEAARRDRGVELARRLEYLDCLQEDV